MCFFLIFKLCRGVAFLGGLWQTPPPPPRFLSRLATPSMPRESRCKQTHKHTGGWLGGSKAAMVDIQVPPQQALGGKKNAAQLCSSPLSINPLGRLRGFPSQKHLKSLLESGLLKNMGCKTTRQDRSWVVTWMAQLVERGSQPPSPWPRPKYH
jgi:hypothetical protein